MIITMFMVQQAIEDACNKARKGLTQEEDPDPWVPVVVVLAILLAAASTVVGALYLVDWLMPHG